MYSSSGVNVYKSVHYLATKDRMERLGIDVEIYYSLSNRGWVMKKEDATPFFSKGDAEGLKDVLAIKDAYVVSTVLSPDVATRLGVFDEDDNEIPHFQPGEKGLTKYMRE